MRRQEISGSFGPSNARVSLNYTQIAQIPGALELEKVKEISATLQLGITRYWSLQLLGTYDLTGTPNATLGENVGTTEALNQGIQLTYRDECLAFITSLTQSGIESGDAIPGRTLLVTLVFKNLGDIGTTLSGLGGGL
jgi:lipopolysaccharide assembly outer membrane protein LptD (OstA)